MSRDMKDTRYYKVKQFQQKLSRAGYHYGHEAADNALVGYDQAIAELREPKSNPNLFEKAMQVHREGGGKQEVPTTADYEEAKRRE